MKVLGWFIAAGGVVYMLFAFNMDVSVSSYSPYGGGEIANLDLMARRQNHLIVAALITMIGVLLALFGPSGEEPSPQAGQPISGAKPQPFNGDRDLGADAYRLWLANTYGIARNDVFDRFVIGDRTFATLDEALAHAHAQELEKDRAVNAAKETREAERRALYEQREAEREAEEARWEANKPKLFVGIGMAIAVMVGAFFLLRETPDEREARLAKEAAEKAELVATVKERYDVPLPEDATVISDQPINGDNEFWCDNNKGSVLNFTTETEGEAIVDLFSKTLGDGESGRAFAGGALADAEADAAAEMDAAADVADYGSFDGNHRWRKKRVDYLLNVYDQGDSNSVYLCRTE